jgi:YebC/PmpR family DNA-binding regulatory protein
MAGHSHSANIKHRKGAVDAKRAKIFSKLARGIASAVRQGGADIEANLKLKVAVEKASAANMPKDNIKRAIQSAAGEKSGSAFEELTYEGYAPGGVAVLVTSLTDNRNRTSSDLKHIFDRGAGNLGTTGSVAFLFDFKSIFVVERGERSDDELMEVALEVGAEDVQLESDLATFLAAPTDFVAVEQALEERGLKPVSAETGYMPQNTVRVEDKDDARRILKLIDALDDHDDVQSVYSNYEMPDEWLEELQG